MADGARRARFVPTPVTLSRDRELPLGSRTLVMARVTARDGLEAAEDALRAVEDGADIVEIQGDRADSVLPAIEALRKRTRAAIGIATDRAATAGAALTAGADILHAPGGFENNAAMQETLADSQAIGLLALTRGKRAKRARPGSPGWAVRPAPRAPAVAEPVARVAGAALAARGVSAARAARAVRPAAVRAAPSG